MRTAMDSAGRVVVPKPLRNALGLGPGVEFEVTEYGSGFHFEPIAGHAHLERIDGRLVAVGDPDVVVTDEQVLALRDADRR